MIAMEFTSKYIHVVDGITSGVGANINRTVSVPVPPRSIRNGYIRNKEEIASILKSALIGQSLKGNQVSLTLDSTALKIKVAELPYEDREKALQFMKRELGNVIADEEYIIDYMIHRVYKKNKKQYMECTIFAIPRDFLLIYSEICNEVGLKLKYIDVLNDSMTKQLELRFPSLKMKEEKPTNKKIVKKKKGKNDSEEEIVSAPSKEKEIVGPVMLWVGLYYEKMKIMTNGIDGKMFAKTTMLEGIEKEKEEEKEESNIEKELIALYVNEIKKFVQFQNNVSPGFPIQQIELYGEHPMLGQICELAASFVNIPTTMLQVPKQVKGISSLEYAKHTGSIGSLLRR